jgi:hypothetical protein
MDPIFKKIILYCAAFYAIIIVVYLPIAYLRIAYKNRKAKHYEVANNAIKFYIKRTIFFKKDLLTVFSVNGEKPVIHRTATRYGYYLLPGTNEIHVQYQWWTPFQNIMQRYILFTSGNSDGDKVITVTAKPDTEYLLYYDHLLKDFILEEIINNKK